MVNTKQFLDVEFVTAQEKLLAEVLLVKVVVLEHCASRRESLGYSLHLLSTQPTFLFHLTLLHHIILYRVSFLYNAILS
jgi:hypothetical protein